jgi:hypothetical protein
MRWPDLLLLAVVGLLAALGLALFTTGAADRILGLVVL